MPTCYAQRVDHLDYNNTQQDISRLVTDGVDTIWIFYSCTTDPAHLGLSKRVFVRKYTISTDHLGIPIQIDDNEAQGATHPDAVILPLEGNRLVCTYMWQTAPSGVGSAGIKAKESTDGGTTWSAGTELTAGIASGQLLESWGIDAEVGGRVMLLMRHSAGPSDTYVIRRSSPGNWPLATLAFDGSSTEQWNFTTNSARNAHVIDGNRACFLGNRIIAGHGRTLRGMYSTTPTTWAETANLYTVGTDVLDFGTKSVRKGGTGRIRAQWVDGTGFPNLMYLGYSDDAGATWTTLGTPPFLGSYGWDVDYPHSIAIDAAGKWFISTTFTTGIAYRVFKGNDDLTSWELVLECPLSSPFNVLTTAGVGEAIFVGRDHFYVGSYVESKDKLMLIKVAGIGGGGPPCTVSGSVNVCPGTSTQLCGPAGDGLTYLWTLPDGSHQTQRCIAAYLYGTYGLVVTDTTTGLSTSCSAAVVQPSNCPPSPYTNPSSNRIFRRGIIKVIQSEAPHPGFSSAPMERLDQPNWRGN